MTFPDDIAIEHLALRMIDRTLPKREWTHAGHFAAALWLSLHRADLTTPGEIRNLITRYNEATDTPNTDIGGYHHTVTLASMRAAADVLRRSGPTTPLHVTLEALMVSELGRPDWMLLYWSRETLFSVRARREWVEPDRHPLPFDAPHRWRALRRLSVSADIDPDPDPSESVRHADVAEW